MKKRSISLLAVTALLLTMLPVALLSVGAATPQTSDALTADRTVTVLQDFSTPLIANGEADAELWYSEWWTNKPAFDATRGLYFTDEGNAGAGGHGSANVKVRNLAAHDFTDAEYLAVTFRKNSVSTTFAAKFSMVTNTDMVLSAGTKILYDNGSDQLQEAIVTNKDDTVTFHTGSADTVKAFIPLWSFCNAYTNAGITSEQIRAVADIGLQFTDLGNKDNTAMSNADAVSVREIALYSEEQTSDPTPAGDALVKDLQAVVLQDFGTPLTANMESDAELWYNDSLTNTPAFSSVKGLYFTDAGNAGTGGHGKANVMVRNLATHDFTDAEYLAVAFRKNSVSAAFTVTFSLITDTDMVLNADTKILYDNGSEQLQEVTVANKNDSVTFHTGSSNVVKAYIPLQSFCNAYTNAGITPEQVRDVKSVGLNFADLGNKDDTVLSNAYAISVQEIALYSGGRDELEESTWRPIGTKVMVQDFEDGDGALHARRFKNQYTEFPNTMAVKNGALVVDDSTTTNQTADFFLLDIDKRVWTGAEYLAMTCKVLQAPSTGTNEYRPGLNFSFGGYAGGQAYLINNGTRYWSKGGKYYEMSTSSGIAYSFTDDQLAENDVFTAYVKISDLLYQWDGTTPLTAAQLGYMDGVAMILPRNKDGRAMLEVQDIALYGDEIRPENGDEVTLPAERVTLQDFTNVDTSKLLHWEEQRDWTPVVENNELFLRGESGYFNLMVTDLMARNLNGMEYLAVTIRYKEATSLQIGLGMLFGGMSYGTGDNNGGQKSYYVDDGQRIREVKTPDVEYGNWVGAIVPAPTNGDIVTLYLPLSQLKTYGSPIDKSLLTGVYLSSGWARSEGWIDETVENPPYLWELEDAFSVLKIEAVGSGFTQEALDFEIPTNSQQLLDFSKLGDDLDYELDNAEAAVEPVMRDGKLWFDDLMGRFAPDTYVIDITNEKLNTYDFRGAKYLAMQVSGQTEHDTTYLTMAMEDEELRQFDFGGDQVYVLAADGKTYVLPYDGRVGINHQFYGKDVTVLFPLEDFILSIYYFGNDYSPLDLSKIGSVRAGVYAGTRYSPVGLQSLSLMGGSIGNNSNNGNNSNAGNNGDDSPDTGVDLRLALPVLFATTGFIGVRISRKCRKAN